jgi:LPS export ABC transporter protein LptC
METRNIRISGGLKAVLPDSAAIETQSAWYDNAARTITTDDPLTITRGPLVMQGVGMVANLGTETVSILKNVHVAGSK